MNPDISFRKAEEKDKPFLLQLRNETMNAHISAAGLTPDNKNHVERINFRFDCACIILLHGIDVGLLKVVKEGGMWDLVQIQLAPAAQGKGTGREIITEVLAQAFRNNAGVKLSVFKTNPAKYLYAKLGFKVYQETETTYEMENSPNK